MTPLLVLAPAGLSVVLLAVSRAPSSTREKIVRGTAWIGVALGATSFLMRDGLEAWRGVELGSGPAAIAGVALACSWGLVIALDLGEDRWWVGALTGVAGTGLAGFAGGQWTIPALLFFGCGSVALTLAASRASRAAWLSLTVADTAIAAALVADLLSRDEWTAPEHVEMPLLICLLIGCGLRIGLVVRLGPLGLIGRPAAALAPVAVAGGLIPVARWVEIPLPLVASGVLLIGIAVVAWSVVRRSFDPSMVGLWPIALGSGIVLISDHATVPAAVAALLGITVVSLWPDALERGRLSRGLVLSGLVPTVMFGAIAIAARASFERATAEGDTLEIASWLTVSGLLPIAFASGVATGVCVARSDTRGGYHPEAVFMTWVVLAASVVAGFALGPSEVYGALGGGPAAGLFSGALILGAATAARVLNGSDSPGSPSADPSAAVTLGRPPHLGRWAAAVSVALSVAVTVTTGWITVVGLQQGFL